MSVICDTRKKKMEVEQLYNLGETRKSVIWRRFGRETQNPAEGALRPSIEKL